MSHQSLTSHLVRSWIELPGLVDEFVQNAAPALGCSRHRLRAIIADELGLDTYDGLVKVCRTVAEAYPLLLNAYEDVDVACHASDREQAGLAAAALRAWREADEDVSGLEKVDAEAIEPMQTLPWREWLKWRNKQDKEEAKQTAYEVLADFMANCHEWREDILNSYTMVHEGTPVGVYAIGAAESLISNASTGSEQSVAQRVERLLSARGFYGTGMMELRGSREGAAALSGWQLTRHKDLLERMEHGDSLIQVRELRDHFRWLPPEMVDGCYEDGPCMWQVLGHLNDDAYVQVSEGSRDEEPRSICPFSTVYVERDEDIAATLRCIGTGGVSIEVVTRGEALDEGIPQIAGWYAIKWWQ